jgi:N-acetyl-gamma-glutamyl-phosphate reductase
MIRVFICGGSGYTGSELLRILSGHPEVAVTGVTSERSAGKSVTDLFPHLRNYSGLVYEPLRIRDIPGKADLFFLALPHGESQEAVDFIFAHGKMVVDLSADYRLKNPGTYSEWYRVPHKYHKTLKKAVYGLPEIYRSRIRKAKLIANPGCYPTGAMLGLLPAIKNNLTDTASIVIDSKSGASGAGRKADIALSYCEVNGGFRAYSVGTHRHTPEIEQELSLLCGKPVAVNFTPHLLPAGRGILTTIYARLAKKATAGELAGIYKTAYKTEPFVRVLDYGLYPDIKHVSGTNFCDVGLRLNETTNTLIIITAIDNLVKGASGQAVQNMNIMMGFGETTALDSLTVFP